MTFLTGPPLRETSLSTYRTGQAFDDPTARKALFDHPCHCGAELIKLDNRINDNAFATATAAKLSPIVANTRPNPPISVN